MLDSSSLRDAIAQKFDRIVDLGNGILRGERLYRDKPFLIAHIDLTDDLVMRSKDLKSYQEKLLGSTFFSSDELRWNSYLYFIAGPKSKQNADYYKAKAIIEEDRHYARKFVVTEQDLPLQFGKKLVTEALERVVQIDINTKWSEIIRAGQLGVLLEQRPRTKTLDLIATGDAFHVEHKSCLPAAQIQDDPLQTAFLRMLTIRQFRAINRGKSFKFGDVNLIFGPNGSGKTSLLESIEGLYCGRVRRDPEADCTDFQAEVELPSGQRITLEATADRSDLKARSMNWYGRADAQWTAVSQGFARFNFLDTDAAFRLSSNPDPAEIRQDVGKLLVGAETTKLWHYLSKLREEIQDKLKELREKQPTLSRELELLEAEVKRLLEQPSEAKTLEKSYWTCLGDIGAKWSVDSKDTRVNQVDRGSLEKVSRGLSEVISILKETPVTVYALREYSRILQGLLNKVRETADEYTRTLEQLNAADRMVSERQKTITLIEKWHQYCLAGVPKLAMSLENIQSRISELRAELSEIKSKTMPEVPFQYQEFSVEDAIISVRDSLKTAIRDELSAKEELGKRQTLDESLSALLRDLHDSALTIIQKTGNESTCPLCGKSHDPNELLVKIQSLITQEDLSQTEGLRKKLNNAKLRVEQHRSALDLLIQLQSYRIAQGKPEKTSCLVLRSEVLKHREELNQLLQEMARLDAAAAALNTTTGLEWSLYQRTRVAVQDILSDDYNLTDLPTIAQIVNSYRTDQAIDLKKTAELRVQAAVFDNQMKSALYEAKIPIAETTHSTPAVTMLERTYKQTEDALVAVNSIARLITIDDNQSLEVLQRAVDHAMTVFDKALHAALLNDQTQIEVKKKSTELDQVKTTLKAFEIIERNYMKSMAVLSPLVTEHPLDKAVKDVLVSIKEQVSEIFTRIHSPHEYKLGDFEGEKLLVTLDKEQPHGVDHISSGQRAAFALSIFLALNQSATSAPPIILIDDPVAHIDDLNALSFLDYLRDLVLGSRKQVFYATADARFAALFQRKFEFLGEERFRTIVLSSAGSQPINS